MCLSAPVPSIRSRVLTAVVACLALGGAPAGPASAGEPQPAVRLEVSVTGTPAVGSTLSATATADQPGTISFQWTRTYNDTGTPIEIDRATRPEFTPNATQRGRVLGLRVVHTDPGGRTTTVVRTVGVIRPGTLPASTVTIRGRVRTGRTLRAVTRRSAPVPVGYATVVRWYAGARRLGTTGRTLRVTPALADRWQGRRLRVRLTATAPGYTARTVASAPTARLR